jgi:flagellar motor switch protein FliN/FliY
LENIQNRLTEMEIDAIGEIMNISLGSSVTSVSTMLDKRVSITTPTVNIITVEQFAFKSFEPAIGVEIKYVEGLQGSNIMILKESDIQVIVGLLLGIDFSQQEFVMDEMNKSAVCEVMNQMMGASATALTQFLGFRVYIRRLPHLKSMTAARLKIHISIAGTRSSPSALILSLKI